MNTFDAVQDETKLPLTSQDVTAERVERLRELFPEAFAEGRIDFERLRKTLGEFVDERPERYGLSWAGKSDAVRAVQSLSAGTLVPVRDESVNFDATENLIIEGDNLEVLKLLQKSYHGKVKMIYIDPPYNTGGDFLYPDNFREGLQTYLQFTGQVDGEGIKLTTNAETDGRFHSKWMNMMYPRLFMAKNLLRDDGIIFVSVDDNEVHNLRLLMSEMFGEENHYATFAWQRRDTPASDSQGVSITHEYVISYVKSPAFKRRLFERTPEQLAVYQNPDNDPRGAWTRGALTRPAKVRKGATGKDDYTIINPKGRECHPPSGTTWRVSRETFERLSKDNRIWWGKEDDSDMPFVKKFLSEVQEGVVPVSWWSYQFAGSNRNATMELRALFPEGLPFESPKPTQLLTRLITLATETGDLILDFFCGSGTTAHATLDVNNKENSNRHFVMVQLPEPTDREGMRTIADVCKERVRRVIKKLNDADRGTPLAPPLHLDRGFKVFKLTSSNFRLWDTDDAPKDAEGLAAQLRLYANHVVAGRSQEDILYELLLKAGLPLTAPVEQREIAGQPVYSIDEGQLLVCLADPIAPETLRGMIDEKPRRVICLDVAFRGNDQLKTNAVLEMKSHSVEFRTV